jgi:hypothetical protein
LKRLEKEVANVQQVSVTLTLPKGLYDQSLRLVEKGIFTSFEEESLPNLYPTQIYDVSVGIILPPQAAAILRPPQP